MYGVEPLWGIQRCPHFTQETSFLWLTFHSVERHDGQRRGIEFPRLFQAYPHTMHVRSVEKGSQERSSQNDLPQKGHLTILSDSSCFKAASP